MTDMADVLSDQLGNVRARLARLQLLESHLVAARDLAHTEDQSTDQATDLYIPLTDDESFTQPPTWGTSGDHVPESAPVNNLVVSLPAPDAHRAQPTPKSGPKGSKYDLAQVAMLAREALANGASIKQYVFDNLPACPSAAMASVLITTARQAGHDIPAARSGPTKTAKKTRAKAVAVANAEGQVFGKVFACTDCDAEFTEVKDIARHTRLTHDRDAARIERTPTSRDAA